MQPAVNELHNESRFDGFLLVRSAEKRTDKKGTPYMDINLCDSTGELNAKVWNLAIWKGETEIPEVGSIVQIKGNVIDYNGRLQLKTEILRPIKSDDSVDFSVLIPVAPEKPDNMLAEIQNTIASFKNMDLARITSLLIEKNLEKLLYYPGAQRIHHAQRSGLLYHTLGVLRLAKKIAEAYPSLDKDLLFAGAIIHDLCKTEEFLSDAMGVVKDYSESGLLLGHIVLGVARIQEAADELGITGEVVLLLQHMMLSHHGEAEYGSPRMPMFPEAEVLHWCDLLDARMNEMQTNLEKVTPGAFTDKIWSLDRRIYRPDYQALHAGEEDPTAESDR